MSNLPDMWRSNFAKEFDRLFDQFGLATGRRFESDLTKYGFNPSCEVNEDKEAYNLRFDLPGVPKDQIKIDLHENRLTVSGERRAEKSDDSKTQHFSEVFYGAFSRSFTFPGSVDSERVNASYDHGILSIVVPKSEGSRTRQISIK